MSQESRLTGCSLAAIFTTVLTVLVILLRVTILNSKTDYALRALLDLAQGRPSDPVQSREIAFRQAVPEAYLNQLLVTLRRAGLVRSVRGANGGYTLGKDAGRLTVAEVFDVLQGEDAVAVNSTPVATASVVFSFHAGLRRTVREKMERTTILDLLTEVQRMDEAQSLMLGL